MELVNRNSPMPCYYQVYKMLKGNIENHTFYNGEQLPSERLLSEQFSVNRFTVRRAIKKLIDDGLVYTVRRKGYFVKTDEIDIHIHKKTSYTQNMLDHNMTPRIEVLGLETQEVTPELADLFKLEKGNMVWSIYILRYYNTIPYALSRMYLSYNRFPDLNIHFMKERSLYKILNQNYGVIPTRVSSVCEACLSDNFESKQLAVLGGVSLLKVTSVAVDQNGTPVEQSISKFRSDMVKVKIDLSNL
ncbi:MAG: GntR family transcriptional regulator [Clostridia bacterium]|nr:GntR family transcriptional regulator [Clostridia bacterium]